MSAQCCCAPSEAKTQAFRRALWIALAVNLAMFLVEIVGGVAAGSLALLADALDFLGDSANYAISLLVLGLLPVWHARAAMIKGVSMAAFGVFVLSLALWRVWNGTTPEPITMGAVGAMALVANVLVAWLLYAFREGNANMRSVWLCSRNDALGNIAVMVAALGVFGTGSHLPDVLVALVMASLALTASVQVIAQARRELHEIAASA